MKHRHYGWFLGAGLSLTGLGLGCIPSQHLPRAESDTSSEAAAFLPPPTVKDAEAPTPRKSEAAPTTEVLHLDALIQEVLTRNPSLAQMTAAWQAASARHPQVSALDDPQFITAIAPASFGTNAVSPGYDVELTQKFPFPGKRALRGEVALAEARASGHDVQDIRLQLVEAATGVFFEYYQIDRALTVNQENLRLLRDFRKNAEARYKTGQVPQQDVLQADVELGKQQERQLALNRMRRVAIARINTLMHLPPQSPLPPPPSEVHVPDALPEVADLLAGAREQRPDLHALAERVAAEQSALALAFKEYAPDFETMAAYNTLMGNGPARDLAPQIGLRLNIPLQRARRAAAVTEAQARLTQRCAELAALTDRVHFQVQEAYELLRESTQTVRLYEKTILPRAEENVRAAQLAYTTGKTPFLTLIEAQRAFVAFRDRSYELIADYYRRKATLERVVGGPLAKRPRAPLAEIPTLP